MIQNRIYLSQLTSLLDNVQQSGRHLLPESPLNVSNCELLVLRNSASVDWFAEMRRAQSLGYTVVPTFRWGIGTTTQENWRSSDWWQQRLIDCRQACSALGVNRVCIDHESYSGGVGQVGGTDEQLREMQLAASRFVEWCKADGIRVDIHPVELSYHFCETIYGAGIDGTAQIYGFRAQRYYWTNAEAYEVNQRDLAVEQLGLLVSWPQVRLGLFQNDGPLRQPFARVDDRFASCHGIVCIDDEYRDDYPQMGLESFERMTEYGHDGLVSCYQTDGVQEPRHGTGWPTLYYDRQGADDYLYLQAGLQWFTGCGFKPNGTPKSYRHALTPPLQVDLLAEADWSQVGLVLGSWPTWPANRNDMDLFKVEYAGGAVTLTLHLDNDTYPSVSIPATLDGQHLLRVFIGPDSFRLAVDDEIAEAAYSGQLHGQVKPITIDKDVRPRELRIWNRRSDQQRRYPFLFPA